MYVTITFPLLIMCGNLEKVLSEKKKPPNYNSSLIYKKKYCHLNNNRWSGSKEGALQ